MANKYILIIFLIKNNDAKNVFNKKWEILNKNHNCKF